MDCYTSLLLLFSLRIFYEIYTASIKDEFPNKLYGGILVKNSSKSKAIYRSILYSSQNTKTPYYVS